MSISLKQSLFFVPKNEHWLSSLLIGGLLLFSPTAIYVFPGIRRLLFNPPNYYLISIFLIFVLVIHIAVCGYFFKTIHNRIVHSAEGLPSWKYIGYYFFVGFKSYVGGFLYSIPFLLLSGLICFLSPLSFTVDMLPFAISLFLLHIFYTAGYIVMALNFSLDFKVKSFLNVKKAILLLKDNTANFVRMIFYCLVLGVVNLILNSALITAQIFALCVPFIVFYICLVYTDLFAQFALNKTNLEFSEEKCCL